MKSDYKPIGNYVRKVEVRNKNLKFTDLRGLSMTKEFREPTSNIIGTDMSVYKVLGKNQFACDFMSVIRVYKLPVVMHTEEKPIIVSPAYTVFEIIDENALLPEYLMMWMKRPEFDRYAFFRCDSAIRGGFGWEELCEVEIPVPDIEIQREIVKEYKVILNRINLNSELIKKIEETSQTIYNKWMVDFEFPDNNGNPYKSSNGKMEYNEDLEKEIPFGWEVKKLSELTKQICVGFVGTCYEYYCSNNEGIPMLRTTDLNSQGMSYWDLKYVTKEFHQKNKKSQLKYGDILVARHGSNGMAVIFDQNFEANCLNTIIIKPNNSLMNSKLIQCFLRSKDALDYIKTSLVGGVQDVLNTKTISNLKLAYPKDDSILEYLSETLLTLEKAMQTKREINRNLTELLNILYSKMSKIITVEVKNEIH